MLYAAWWRLRLWSAWVILYSVNRSCIEDTYSVFGIKAAEAAEQSSENSERVHKTSFWEEENDMVQLIVGCKGKGKTKILLDRVNEEVKSANGSIVYIDKSKKHMFELNNKVRLIDASAYPLKNADEFVGFICGIISQDHDLETIYLDSFLKVAKLEGEDVAPTIEQLQRISSNYNVAIVVSVSMDKEELPESLYSYIVVDL